MRFETPFTALGGVLKILFVTDLHASTKVLEKAMEEAVRARVDLLIVSGDLEGKYLIFVEERGANLRWEDPLTGSPRRSSREELAEVFAEIARYGGYGILVPEGWDPDLQEPGELDGLLNAKAIERLSEWVAVLESFQAQTGIRVAMMPGNDDPVTFDEVIRAPGGLLALEKSVAEVGGFRFLGYATVPPTPWRTPREASESEIGRGLEELCSLGDLSLPIVLVAHTPPFACGLDQAPLLDRLLRQVFLGGVLQTEPVGSKALRTFLESRTDVTLGLHGHIHEAAGWARVGPTLCLNPGTEYFAGILVAHHVELAKGRVNRFERIRI